VLAVSGREPAVARSIDARLVWLSDEPFAAGRGYLLRTATDLVPIVKIDMRTHLDLETLEESPASTCAANDIVLAHIELGRSAAVDRFSDLPATGSFMLVDPISGASVAGGVVATVHGRKKTTPQSTFRLTRDLLARGIGADLGPTDGSADQELRRRANEVAILLREAGVPVEIEDTWGRSGVDASVVWLWLMAGLSFGFIGAILSGLI
jgi:bifunctional enzyme CysN/CysC